MHIGSVRECVCGCVNVCRAPLHPHLNSPPPYQIPPHSRQFWQSGRNRAAESSCSTSPAWRAVVESCSWMHVGHFCSVSADGCTDNHGGVGVGAASAFMMVWRLNNKCGILFLVFFGGFQVQPCCGAEVSDVKNI